jgi:folylpolyglutamate synthase/dihydropteroate synthase
LGGSIDEIAYHKKGIIKQGIPVVVGVDHPLFIAEAQEKGSPFIYTQKEVPTNMI